MYKIFVGNKPIVLTTALETETDFKNFMIDAVNINKVLAKLKKDKYNSVRIVGVDKEVLLKKFLALLPNVIAGGGKVYNPKNEILFIFRNGKWDLPKGKLEVGENIKECAIREVEEECGISGLSINKPLQDTYHVYELNEQKILKRTYWFEMKTDFNGNLTPQTEEGITQVVWVDKQAIAEKLENSFGNINELLKA